MNNVFLADLFFLFYFSPELTFSSLGLCIWDQTWCQNRRFFHTLSFYTETKSVMIILFSLLQNGNALVDNIRLLLHRLNCGHVKVLRDSFCTWWIQVPVQRVWENNAQHVWLWLDW